MTCSPTACSCVSSSIVADRMSVIKPSPTLAVSQKARDLKAQGLDVIDLSSGEPDFDTPDFIKDAAIAAIKAGKTKYTAVDGIAPLKDAIIAKLKRDNQVSYVHDQIIVGTGGKHVLYNAMMASINPGDEVIIPAPYWVSYPDMALLAGGKPVCVPCVEANNFKITPTELESAITPKTRWLILNSPSNPTGACYTASELKALAQVLARHPHVWICCDDIYEYLTYDGFQFYSLLTVAPELSNRCLIVNGASKAFAMTGWRMGFGAGPSELIKAMVKLQSQSTTNPTSITQEACVAAFNGDLSYLESWKETYKSRRNMMVAAFNATPGLSCRTPEGAFYLYVNCAQLIGKKTPAGKVLEKDLDVCAYILEEALVATVPGSAFGLAPYFRISYATATSALEQAAQRIPQALAKLS